MKTKNNDKKDLGSLLPSDRELDYLRKQFVQSAKLQGRIGNFYQVITTEYKGTDQHYTYKEPVRVAYHLVENPSRRILLRYGWFTEDQTSLPIVLYLTYHDMDDKPIIIQEGSILEISGHRNIQGTIEIAKFIITELRTDLELNQCVCKVTPYREKQKENVKVLADKKDPNLENVYINREIYYDDNSELLDRA